jgi:hypothetical protein
MPSTWMYCAYQICEDEGCNYCAASWYDDSGMQASGSCKDYCAALPNGCEDFMQDEDDEDDEDDMDDEDDEDSDEDEDEDDEDDFTCEYADCVEWGSQEMCPEMPSTWMYCAYQICEDVGCDYCAASWYDDSGMQASGSCKDYCAALPNGCEDFMQDEDDEDDEDDMDDEDDEDDMDDEDDEDDEDSECETCDQPDCTAWAE